MPSASPTTALFKVSDYITDARVLLQDQVAPERYDDASLITALNLALLEARRVRADLFVYNYCEKMPQFSTNDVDSSTEVKLESPFRMGVLYGLVAHAYLRDQEDIQDAKAAQFTDMFYDILIGVRPARPKV